MQKHRPIALDTCPTPEKKRFGTKDAAKLFIKTAQPHLKHKVYPYKCHCGMYHFTHLTRDRQRTCKPHFPTGNELAYPERWKQLLQ